MKSNFVFNETERKKVKKFTSNSPLLSRTLFLAFRLGLPDSIARPCTSSSCALFLDLVGDAIGESSDWSANHLFWLLSNIRSGIFKNFMPLLR